MSKNSIGNIIARERKKKGISQETLSKGICSVSTLSRLENGRQTTSQYVVDSLCQRLELSTDDLSTVVGSRDMQIESLRREIISLNVRFEEATEVERSEIRKNGYAKIHAMEKLITKDDQAPRQLLLRSRLILGKEDGTPYRAKEETSMLLGALSFSAPGFDLEHMERWHLTLDEVKIINQIAHCYYQDGQQERSMALYAKLFAYLQEQKGNSAEVARQICLVANNYAGKLRMQERFQEAIGIAELGRKACQNFGHYEFLGGLTHTLAECYHFLGDNKKSVSLFLQAYSFYQFTGNQKGVELLQEDARAYFPELEAILSSIVSGLFG